MDWALVHGWWTATAPFFSVLAPCLALVLAVWVTYFPSRSGDLVIDDLESVGTWKGQFWDRSKENQPIKQLSYGICFRYLRWLVGRMPNPNYGAINQPHQPRFLNDPAKHHRFSLIMASAALVALYAFLAPILGERTAFFACLLFAVHPTGNQTIAWISGLGYCVALFFASLAGSAAALIVSSTWPLGVTCAVSAGFVILYWLAVEAMFAAASFVVIFALLGWWGAALAAGLIASLVCSRTFAKALTLRTNQFKAQLMDASLKITMKKCIVVPVKTLAYNVALICWPQHLGQFHTFGYHYEVDFIEREDRMFWGGVLLVCLSVWAILAAPFPVRFGVVWCLALLAFFLNWITANQFVAERYAWMPTIGIAIIMAWCVGGTPLYWGVIGMLLMRTWAQLPAYRDEMQFYLLNCLNFPNSEVSYGNLGAAYGRRGMNGAAMDMWFLGTRINPNYDVNWYNLFTTLRTQAVREGNLPMFEASRPHLVKALTCKICHFPKQWTEELRQLDAVLLKNMKPIQVPLPDPVIQRPPPGPLQ